MRELIRHILREHTKKNILEERNPRGFWTDDRLKEITSEYDNYTLFNKEQPDAVIALRRKGLLDDYTSHMLRTHREPYTDEELEQEARKYSTISDFKENSPLYYKRAVKRGLMGKFREFLNSKVRSWTDEELKKEVEKYEFFSDFKENSPSAYTIILKRGLSSLLDNLIRKGHGTETFWTKDKIIDVAKNFETLKDFEKSYPGAVTSARKNGWIDELKNILVFAKRDFWTLEKVIDIAKNYDTIKDFRLNNKQAYDISVHHGWLEDLKKVLKSARGEEWTLEKVKDIASKYTNLTDFFEKDKLAYFASLRHGWHDEVTNHMVRVGNLVKRAVYVFEFPDKSVYVGLTLNLGQREKQHLSDESYSSVSKYIKKTNLKPEFKIISQEYLDATDAANLEKCTIEKYKEEGWRILNKMKGGGLGYACVRVYTLEKVKQDASVFERPSEFKKNNPGSYSAALRNGWLDEVTSHMKRMKRKIKREDVAELVKKYEFLSDFEKEQPSYYHAARREGWLDLLSNLKRKQRMRGSKIFIP